MAADSAATMAAHGGVPTIQHPVRKLFNIGDRLLVGSSGPIGLSQVYREILTHAVAKKELGREKCPTPIALCDHIRSILGPAWEQGVKFSAFGANHLHESLRINAQLGMLVGYVVGDEVGLAEFQNDLSFELMTVDLPFNSIGSGKALADPLLSFVLDAFGGKEHIDLQNATTILVWVLDQAIKASPGYLGLPVTVSRIERSGSGFDVTDLSEAHLESVRQRIQDIKQGISDVIHQKALAAEAPGTIGTPPEPPDSCATQSKR
ncbi:MAG: hypothetical protein AKCLJLPJ_02208 [Fimbriimonadales bacterium]|nr:hypothetical protein [Fimbriimonadales bacterium]